MKINFSKDVLPHALAVLLFFLVTVIFFSPVFFENKSLSQYDIQQHLGASKALRDYREATGEEGLWASTMFSGMPAYLVNLQWSDGVVVGMKRVMSLFLPHPVSNVFLAFVCYYIMLLSFRVRPYLAMTGALAFGLSSFMIIGLIAGHNARIGAIAFMPLVMAGIHLVFSGQRILGFAVTASGLAFHLRENHLQMTYYLMILVAGYGLMQLILASREKKLADFFKNIGLLVPAVVLAAGTFFGQFWAITEYSRYSIRGPSELKSNASDDATGLSKAYAFEFSNAITEPMTLFIPNYFGGASSDYLFQNEKSATYSALVNSGSNELANQLAPRSSAYWGPQRMSAPYYAGAVICLLFVLGAVFADTKYVIWLAGIALLGIVLSWGSNFAALNYALFDYFPGYNKFRSVTFALILTLFALPLLGMLGVEKLLSTPWNKEVQKKFLWALLVPGICLVLAVSGGFGSFLKPEEAQLPAWFRSALRSDRMDLLQADAWRSFWFTLLACGVLFASLRGWVKSYVLTLSLLALLIIDITLVDRRYLSKDNFQRKRPAAYPLTSANQAIMRDPGYFRVYDLQGSMNDASASYYHNSIGGYHGAKLRRYQDLVDSCVSRETEEMINGLRQGKADFTQLSALNMLNVKYITYGGEEGNIIPNASANGPAWFVREVKLVNSPAEELQAVCGANTSRVAVVDGSKFKINAPGTYDSAAMVRLVEQKPPYLKYEAVSVSGGLVVFSEIYYPKGWHAFLDGKEVPLIRANYVLRAMEVPAGTHTLEMKFEPKPYVVGNKVTMASSWLLLLVVVGGVVMAVRKSPTPNAE
ncbi:MAG: hypothetical protein JNN04_11445 [Cyclobacteriaceae bacterium]|nr:hypothetical protein [Cyclobacteriaceae bacterium]